MSAYESTLRPYLGRLCVGKRVLGGLLALALATVTTGCVVEIDDESELVATADAAWVGDGGDLEIAAGAELDEPIGLDDPTADTEERSVNPEPQPWNEAQSSNEEAGDEEGNPEPQPWRRNGETDNPEPQPWYAETANELDDEQSDEPSAPTRHLLDDDEPDPNPWMVAAR